LPDLFDVWMQLPQPVNGKLPWTLISRKVTEEQADTITEALIFPTRSMPATEGDK